MLSDEDLSALVRARHPDPFGVLGLRADAQGQWCVRALLPNAVEVEVVDLDGNRIASMQSQHAAGVYEAAVPGPLDDYRLRVRWDSGVVGLYADPYAFGPLISDDDLHSHSEAATSGRMNSWARSR